MPQRHRQGRSPAAPIDVKAMRQRMGLSQTDLVEKIYGERNRMHKRTIRRWEQKTHEPGAMARRHLERVQQEFDSQQAEAKANGSGRANGKANGNGGGGNGKASAAAPPSAGAVRVKGTKVPTDISTSSEPTRPANARLAPGITSTNSNS